MSSLPSRKKNKAFRLITSSLLSSDLTSRDLHHIADALSHDSRFQGELSFRLHEAASMFEDRFQGSGSSTEEHLSDETDLVSTGLRIVKQRRLAKREILKRLRSISPGAADFFERNNAPVREILTRFATREPESKMREFIAALAGPGEADEYLKGIVKQ
jgi:hypothetical protein